MQPKAKSPGKATTAIPGPYHWATRCLYRILAGAIVLSLSLLLVAAGGTCLIVFDDLDFKIEAQRMGVT